jgi:hypothetical protein
VPRDELARATRICIGVDRGVDRDYAALAVVGLEPRFPAADQIDLTDSVIVEWIEQRARAGRPPRLENITQGWEALPENVAERYWQKNGRLLPYYRCVIAERLPLGTPEGIVAERTAALYGWLKRQYGVPIQISIDIGGGGRKSAAYELFVAAGVPPRVITPVQMTGGAERNPQPDGEIHLSVVAMVNRLSLLFNQRRLGLPANLSSALLLEELRHYRRRLSKSLRVLLGAPEQLHDDLLNALGLAIQEPDKQPLSTAGLAALQSLRVYSDGRQWTESGLGQASWSLGADGQFHRDY